MFPTRKEAADALARELETVRLGTARRDLTLRELIDEYLAQHIGQANTLATLTAGSMLSALARQLSSSSIAIPWLLRQSAVSRLPPCTPRARLTECQVQSP